jgi:NADPH-dependent F420 reductase
VAEATKDPAAAGKAVLAIIGGTGPLGSGLARRLAAAGYPVIIGSRTAAKAEAAAHELGGAGQLSGSDNRAAARSAEVVLVTVPWSSQAAILEEIKPEVAGKLVIDTTVPLVPPKVARVELPAERSAALAAQARLGGGVRVVSAFHNVAAHKLMHDGPIDCDVLVFGDDRTDREIAAGLIKAIGLVPVDAGPLANSVAAEAMTSVLIGINRKYRVDGAGIRITGLARD